MKNTETVRAKASPAVSGQMKRKAGGIACTCGAELFTLGWVAGLLSAFFGAAVPAAVTAAVLFAGLCLLRRKRIDFAYLRVFAGILLGLAVWTRFDVFVRQPLLMLDGTKQICTGTVTEAEPLSRGRTKYTLRTTLADCRVSIDWYADEEIPQQRIGDTVELRAEFSRIQPDYRYHTAESQAGKGRYLRIYDAELLSAVPDTGFSLRRTVSAYRQRMTGLIRMTLPPEDAGLLCAMLLGDKTLLSDETRQSLNRTGVGHIAVVSGLHLVLFSTVLGWILKRLRCPRRLAFLIQIPAVLLFILLVDASAAVWRAAVMLLIAQSAPLFGRRGNTLRALCLAVLLCTAFTPYVIGSVSFWLSVSGVLGIGVIAPYMTKDMKRGLLRDLMQLCCVAVTVFPASVLLCGESSLLAPVCNLLILPLCTAVMYAGFAFLMTGGALRFLLPVTGFACRVIRFLAKSAAALPFSHVTVTAPAMRVILILCTAVLALLLIRRAKPQTVLAAAVCAVLMLSLENLLLAWMSRDELRIAVLGGKQNAVLVIGAENRTVIADLTDTPRNAQYVQRYLQDSGITRVDAMLLQSSRTAANYQAELTGIRCGTLLLRDGNLLRSHTTVFGAEPVADDNSTVTVRCGDAQITAEADALRITWNGMTVCASDTLNLNGNAAAIRYGRDGCAVQLSTVPPETAAGNNTLLCLTRSGGGRLTSLMNPA